MELNQIARWLIFLGIGFSAAGLIIWFIGKVSAGREFPGTISFQIGGLTCSFPILLSVVLSIVLTIVLNIIARFMNR